MQQDAQHKDQTYCVCVYVLETLSHAAYGLSK